MRIITGSARGTKLASLEGDNTRPTSDRVKEAVFSMIQFDIEGRAVLDLFAGSGQLALEALSRGAAKATLIDSSRDAVGIIIENARKTKLYDRCRISSSDFTTFIRGASGREKYDIVFLDPPYRSGLVPEALRGLSAGDILARGSVIVCETENDIPPKLRRARRDESVSDEYVMKDVFGNDEALASAFTVLKTGTYAHTRITLLTPAAAGSGKE